MLVFGMLVFSAPAYAQGIVVNAGVTPDSPFWALDKLIEKLELKLTFDKAKKVEKRIKFAEERVAEAEEMAKKNKSKDAEKALAEHNIILSEAQLEAQQITDTKGIMRAIQAIDEHIKRLEEKREQLLVLLPEEAKDKVEEHLEKAEEHSVSVKEHLEEVEERKSEKIDAILASISSEVGVDAKADYERLMSGMPLSDSSIQKYIEYANRQGINLFELEGKSFLIQIVNSNDVVTQKIFLQIRDGEIVVIRETDVDGVIEIEADEIPDMLEELCEGDIDDVVKKLAKGCGIECTGIAKDIIKSKVSNR
jgi:Asp/Glu/hydantoin racemase